MGKSKSKGIMNKQQMSDLLNQQMSVANQQMGLANRQMGMAENVFGATDPLRDALIQNFGHMAGLTNAYGNRGANRGNQPQSFTLPNGSTLPMGGYSSGSSGNDPYAGMSPVERLPGSQRGILFERTPDIRNVTLGNITSHPMYAAQKRAIEGAYGQSRDALMEQLPGERYSGAAAGGLSDLLGNRASQMSTSMGAIGASEMDRRDRMRTEEVIRRATMLDLAMQLGSGGVAGGQNAMAGAAASLYGSGAQMGGMMNTQQQLLQNQSQQQTEKGSNVGSFLGMMGGASVGGPAGAAAGAGGGSVFGQLLGKIPGFN